MAERKYLESILLWTGFPTNVQRGASIHFNRSLIYFLPQDVRVQWAKKNENNAFKVSDVGLFFQLDLHRYKEHGEGQVWFHQHFRSAFFVQKYFAQLFSNYSLALYYFGKRILAQKLLEKCWWNRLQNEIFRCSASEDCDFQTKYRQTLSTHIREKHEGKKRVEKQPEGTDTYPYP